MKPKKYKKILKSLLSKLTEGKLKVTAIIGAGASDYEKFGVPKLKKKLLNSLKGKRPNIKNVSLSYMNKELDKCGLEELLSIYGNIYRKPIGTFLENMGIKPKEKIKAIPYLSYEILAHFIKYRLIDFTISFNFDEYLEISLDNEIGYDNYEWVKSKSIFQKLTEDIRLGLWPHKPLLIKPHGTISYPATIRPTFETVQQFEEEKRELLEKVLKHSSVLLILGFSCPDADFQKILKPFILAYPKREIFWIDTKKDFSKSNEMFKFAKKRLGKKCIHIPKTIDKFLVDLAGLLHEEYKTRYPGITPHKIRAKFAEWKALDSTKNLFKLETIIYAVRARGMFSLEDFIVSKRTNNCCKSLSQSESCIKDIFLKFQSNILKKNNEITTTEVYYIPIFEDQREMGDLLKKVSNIKNIRSSSWEFDMIKKFKQLLKASKRGNEQKYKLLQQKVVLSKKILQKFNIPLRVEGKSKIFLLAALIEELMKDFDFDLAEIDNYVYLKFRRPKIIKDYKELFEYSKKTILSATKEINIITETGEWIRREEFQTIFKNVKNKNRSLQFKLILAEPGPEDDSHQEVQKDILQWLEKFFGNRITVRYLPWDKHRTHMTITEKGKGIYFYRKYKSSIFTPFYIDTNEDCAILKTEFDKNWDC